MCVALLEWLVDKCGEQRFDSTGLLRSGTQLPDVHPDYSMLTPIKKLMMTWWCAAANQLPWVAYWFLAMPTGRKITWATGMNTRLARLIFHPDSYSAVVQATGAELRERPPFCLIGMPALIQLRGINLLPSGLPDSYLDANWALARLTTLSGKNDGKTKYLIGAHVFRARNDGQTTPNRSPTLMMACAFDMYRDPEHPWATDNNRTSDPFRDVIKTLRVPPPRTTVIEPKVTKNIYFKEENDHPTTATKSAPPKAAPAAVRRARRGRATKKPRQPPKPKIAPRRALSSR